VLDWNLYSIVKDMLEIYGLVKNIVKLSSIYMYIYFIFNNMKISISIYVYICLYIYISIFNMIYFINI